MKNVGGATDVEAGDILVFGDQVTPSHILAPPFASAPHALAVIRPLYLLLEFRAKAKYGGGRTRHADRA